jgi:hypothetical protein
MQTYYKLGYDRLNSGPGVGYYFKINIYHVTYTVEESHKSTEQFAKTAQVLKSIYSPQLYNYKFNTGKCN